MIDIDQMPPAVQEAFQRFMEGMRPDVEKATRKLRRLDPEGEQPYRGWKAVVQSSKADPSEISRPGLMAWGEHYTGPMIKRYESMVIEIGRTTECDFPTAVAEMIRAAARDDGAEVNPAYPGQAPHVMLMLVAVKVAENLAQKLIVEAANFGSTPGPELPDCGDPNCTGHHGQREGRQTFVVPTGSGLGGMPSGVVSASDDTREGLGMYL